MFHECLKYINTIGSCYFMIAGIAFVLFYMLFKNISRYKKLQPKSPKLGNYAREIGYSVTTIRILPWRQSFFYIFLLLQDTLRITKTLVNTDKFISSWLFHSCSSCTTLIFIGRTG